MWSKECVRVRERVDNPLMTFPIKKRIYPELFIDRMAALHVGEALIRIVTVDQSASWYLLIGGVSIRCVEMLFWTKSCGNERSGVNPSSNESNENVMKLEHRDKQNK